jgi:lipopolysaccharide transport system ATP-binding protein
MNVIQAQGLSKKFQLGLIGSASLRESLVLWKDQLLGRNKAKTKDFWALQDLSFEIKQGEVVGIIGHNGAGKSTLLKILSRITEPTAGQIEITGRVASLLEVGTGFHPELTGRENIFLNGSILGMSRREIHQKFDEIVAFSDIEAFIDTPVKRYSSGMYVRLAFSVAAHLEPEILIVDEVLAVGDIAFQKKCLGKMEDVSSSGRTVLFVSHNMEAMQTLTQRAMLLHHGQMVCFEDTPSVLKRYLDIGGETNQHYRNEEPDTSRDIECLAASIESLSLHELQIRLRYIVRRPSKGLIALEVVSVENVAVFTVRDTDQGRDAAYDKATGEYETLITIPIPSLAPNVYGITISIAEQGIRRHHYLKNVLGFEVATSVLEDVNKRSGVVHLPSTWSLL